MARKITQTLHDYSRNFQSRQAARQRLPAWLKFLLPFTALSFVFGVSFVVGLAAHEVHRLMYPGAPFNPLILFPAFFAAVTPGLMAANLALRLIPPVKSALDQNAHGVPGASYRHAMHDLGKASAFLVPIGLALALIAAAQPWAYAQ